jgi:cell division protein FtsL
MARSKYQYGTSPRKLEPEYNPYKQKNTNNQRKLEVRTTEKEQKTSISKFEKIKITKRIGLVLVIFAVLLTISYRNSQINESFNQVQSLKKELASVEKENEQLKVNIENSLNLNNIEQAAKEKLGMQKLSNKQTVYVSLPKKDYIESATEEVSIDNTQNWFEKILSYITNK